MRRDRTDVALDVIFILLGVALVIMASAAAILAVAIALNVLHSIR